MSKSPWKSKTLWVNLIMAVMAIAIPGFNDWTRDNAINIGLIQGLLAALINIVLRLFFTKTDLKVPMKTSKNRRYMLPFCLFSLCFLLLSCGSVNQILETDVFYHRVMPLEVKIGGSEDAKYTKRVGYYVAPMAEKYFIKLKSTNRMDLVTIESCAREDVVEKAGNKAFLGSETSYVYEYIPDLDLEYNKPCPLNLTVYDAKKNAHLWGYIDFVTDMDDLPATMICNGRRTPPAFVNICGTRQGLNQKIIFDVEVMGAPDQACKWGIEDDRGFLVGKEFEFQCPLGDCYYTFTEMQEPYRSHRLTTLCHSDIVIQEQ